MRIFAGTFVARLLLLVAACIVAPAGLAVAASSGVAPGTATVTTEFIPSTIAVAPGRHRTAVPVVSNPSDTAIVTTVRWKADPGVDVAPASTNPLATITVVARATIETPPAPSEVGPGR